MSESKAETNFELAEREQTRHEMSRIPLSPF